MKLWITRDENRTLVLHESEPYCRFGNWHNCNQEFYLDSELFPEVTYENSPQEVELRLCNHIDTVRIQDHNPKKQPCVMTNHGLVTDVVFKY